jgi:hypothetical protein
MHGQEQRGKENASRLPSTHGALAVLAAASVLVAAPARLHGQSLSDTLPNAPSALLFAAKTNTRPAEEQNAAQNPPNAPQNPTQNPQPIPPMIAAPTPQTAPVKPPFAGQPSQAQSDQAASRSLPRCPTQTHTNVPIIFLPPTTQPPCQQEDQLQLIGDAGYVKPLTSTQKGILAVRAVMDPFNLLSIVGFSAIEVAANSHSAYGPGFAGWGRLSGYSLAEDIQGEFTGTYLIPSLVHEDPRYHRMSKAAVSRRIKHALIHSFVSQHDDGALMPNYATLINAPLSAEISNLYVPGIATNGPSTAKRIFVTYGTDPIGPLVAEFLPDVAKRIHVNILFEQQLLNRIALGAGSQPGP